MRIGSAIVLIALGAILAFAVNADVPYVSSTSVDTSSSPAACWVSSGPCSPQPHPRHRVHVRDPSTGETVHRAESHDGL